MIAGVRPQHIEIVATDVAPLKGTVMLVEHTGCETNVILTVGDCEWTVQTLNRHRLNQGEQVGLKFDPAHLHLFSASSQERIIW